MGGRRVPAGRRRRSVLAVVIGLLLGLLLAACGGDEVDATIAIVDKVIEEWNAQNEEFVASAYTEDAEWSNRNGTSRSGADAINEYTLQFMFPPERHIITRVGDGIATDDGSVIVNIDYDINGKTVEVVWEVRTRGDRVSFLRETARTAG